MSKNIPLAELPIFPSRPPPFPRELACSTCPGSRLRLLVVASDGWLVMRPGLYVGCDTSDGGGGLDVLDA